MVIHLILRTINRFDFLFSKPEALPIEENAGKIFKGKDRKAMYFKQKNTLHFLIILLGKDLSQTVINNYGM